MTKPLIRLNQVSKCYHEHLVLDSIDLELYKDKFIVILGPSGSGKTTLLKIIAGLDKTYEGEVSLDLNPSDITMFFQSYALFPFLNVYENISISLESYSKRDKQEIIEEITRELQIDSLLKRSIKELSGGEAQRVALARTIAAPAKLCLMDEPLSHLDTTLQFDTMNLIKSIHRKKKWTTLYVTHQLKEALFLADLIVVMKEGRIEQIGTYDELYHHPNNQFVASFVSEYPINLIEGNIEKNTFSYQTFCINLKTSYEGLCTLGIRKEDILISNMKSSIFVNHEMIIDHSSNSFSQIKFNDLTIWVTIDSNIDFSQPLYLHIDINKVHLFDINTKNTIKKGI